MSSVSLITRYLGLDVQAEIALNLSCKLGESRENVDALYELIEGLDLQLNPAIYTNVLTFFKGELNRGDTQNYDSIVKFVLRVDRLQTDLLNSVLVTLQNYIKRNIGWFIPEFPHVLRFDVESSVVSDEVSREFVVYLLGFLDLLFRSTDSVNDEIDSVLLMYLGINEESMSNIVSKLLRWRMGNIIRKTRDSSKIWDIIFALQATKVSTHTSHSFILWLRYLNHEEFTNNAIFERIISGENYWNILQSGLVSDSHDHRKFCLSILQLSVKSIDTSFTNGLISWDNSKKALHLKEWARFITLFEIMAIDTSLHQAEAGSNEITSMISPNSLIHPSWGFCLLSTGFKASMDSVRKFSLNLLLSISNDHIYLIKHGLPFLEEVFLPYAMLASHYIVRDGKCDFGTRMSVFISSTISNLKEEKDYQNVTYSILKVLNNLRGSFDPARIYITYGILSGLHGRKCLEWGRHDLLLVDLFESNSEGDVFETSLQTLNLRLLVNFAQTDIAAFYRTLGKFTKFNGYELFRENYEILSSYVRGFDDVSVNSSDSSSYQIFAAIFSGKFPTESSLLFKILETGVPIPSDFQGHYHIAFQILDGSFEALSKVDFSKFKKLIPADFNYFGLWESIIVDIQSDDYHVLTTALAKHRFFNQLYENGPILDSFDQICELKGKLLNNTAQLNKTVKNFYKLREEFSGEFFKTLEIYSRYNKISKDFNTILSWMDPNCSNYRCNYSMVKLIQAHFAKEADVSLETIGEVCSFMADLWESLDTTRLQLNQKELHLMIIDTYLDPKILTLVDSKSIVDSVRKFCLSVIDNSVGRRSLLPLLTKNLSHFQIHYPEFERIEWIPEILVKSLVCFQLRSNIFRLENIIGEFFDENICAGDSHLYNKVNGPEEISSKINVMAILNSVKTSEFANKLFKYLVSVEEDYNLFTVIKQVDGFGEWRRIQLFSYVICIVDKIDMGEYLDIFFKLLETEPSPLARLYVEWVVAYNLLDNESYTSKIFDKLLEKGSAAILKPSVVISYQRILFLMMQQLDGQKEIDLLSRFLTVVIPGGTSNKAIIRHFSVSLTVSIYSEIKSKQLTLDANLINMLRNMYNSALGSDSFFQYRSGDALLWDIVGDLTLVSISGSVLMRLSDREEIENIEEAEYKKYLSKEQVAFLSHEIGKDKQELWIRERKQHQYKTVAPVSEKDSSPLQTKSGAWNTVMDVDETSRGAEIVRGDLIVVSSLVDKPPNLGGICRLCDVLGAGLLTLNDLNVKNHTAFKSVAVTADQWMPMLEVKATEIYNFLQLKKREGYTLVGLEQTDGSVQLSNELKLPKKTLLLIGREKEGIPGDLLAELDLCVEIKQVGVVRSMNIQTATAILVNAYSMQHC